MLRISKNWHFGQVMIASFTKQSKSCLCKSIILKYRLMEKDFSSSTVHSLREWVYSTSYLSVYYLPFIHRWRPHFALIRSFRFNSTSAIITIINLQAIRIIRANFHRPYPELKEIKPFLGFLGWQMRNGLVTCNLISLTENEICHVQKQETWSNRIWRFTKTEIISVNRWYVNVTRIKHTIFSYMQI